MHPGQGPGLSLHDLGESGGTETVTLLESEIPSHNHNLTVTSLNSQSTTPINNNLGRGNPVKVYTSGGSMTTMGIQSIAPTGGDQPHNNLMPYVTMYFCISLQGVFPPRT